VAGDAKGGRRGIIRSDHVLDMRIAGAHAESALARLRQSQTSSGGFPWFPGGPSLPVHDAFTFSAGSRKPWNSASRSRAKW